MRCSNSSVGFLGLGQRIVAPNVVLFFVHLKLGVRMATDLKLDQADGSFLELDARIVKSTSSDFMLDFPDRRKAGAVLIGGR